LAAPTGSGLGDVAATQPALGHGPVGVGDLIQRHDRVHPGWELTGSGAGEASLQDVMRGIKEWAETHMDEVLANREEYDTRVA
jgi:hypothetical protein